MKVQWLYLSWLLPLEAFRRKGYHHYALDDVTYDTCSPIGPLGNSYLAKLRLPGFPFEFPPIYPETTDRYLIFPEPDTLAEYDASERRCQVYKGTLVRIESPVELEILACAIGAPSFIGGWNGTVNDGDAVRGSFECMVLHPGGVLSISAANCKRVYGSICKIPKGINLEGFQL